MAVITKTSCEVCGSSDAKAVYEDGSTYCFSAKCNTYTKGDTVLRKSLPEMVIGVTRDIPARRLTKDTCAKYGYQIAELNGEKVHCSNYYDSSGTIIGQHYRNKDKKMWSTGKVTELYGKWCFDPN